MQNFKKSLILHLKSNQLKVVSYICIYCLHNLSHQRHLFLKNCEEIVCEKIQNISDTLKKQCFVERKRKFQTLSLFHMLNIGRRQALEIS